MTKFEQVGVNLQRDASTKKDVARCFRNSCRICCERGLRIDCERCAIAANYEIVMAAFAATETKAEWLKNVEGKVCLIVK